MQRPDEGVPPAGLLTIQGDTFKDCTGITSLTLPAGLTKIGLSPFAGCTGLTSVIFPAGLVTPEAMLSSGALVSPR